MQGMPSFLDPSLCHTLKLRLSLQGAFLLLAPHSFLSGGNRTICLCIQTLTSFICF